MHVSYVAPCCYDAGKKHHTAIEHKSLPIPWPKLGAKMVLDDAVVVQDGMFLLTPSTCGYLGGSVEEFCVSQSVLEKVLQEPMYGRRGPPLRLEEYMKILEDKVAVACQSDREEQPLVEAAPRSVQEHQRQESPTIEEKKVEEEEKEKEEENKEAEEYVIDSDSDANIDIEEIVRQKRSSRELDDVIIVDESLPIISNEHCNADQSPVDGAVYNESGSPSADTRDPVRDSFAGTFEALKRRRAMRQSGA